MKNIFITVLLTASIMPLAAQDGAPVNENVLRILSYNVRNFVGMDGERNYKRIADVINRVTPDIVAIQEVDSATRRSAGIYTLQEAADLTGMFATYAAAIDFQGGKYGVGILSKRPPVTVRQYPLPGREELRTLLVVEFEKYIVACTHFSLNDSDRLTSVSLINEIVKGTSKPLFLVGDMNSTPDSPTQTAISRTFATLSDVRQNTFPSAEPDCCIDYIYLYRNGHNYVVQNSCVIDEPLASDHRPLYVDVQLIPSKRI